MQGKLKVEVDWWDAHATGVSAYAEHEIPHAPVVITTLGWLLKEDDTGISVASEYCGDGTWRGITFIPHGMVKDVRRPRPRKSRAKEAVDGAVDA